MAEVSITGGVTIVDEIDLPLVAQYKWHVNDSGYAVWRGVKDGRKQTLRLHRLIAGTPPDKVTDHINHDRLDNRRTNLRIVTQTENASFRKTPQGVCWDASRQRWMVRYRNKFGGRYESLAEAETAFKMIRSGVPYKGPGNHPRRLHLPKGVCYMKSGRQSKRFYVRPTIMGRRRFIGYFGTAHEAEVALLKALSKED